MIWPQVGAYMGLNVHVMCKCICNRVDLVIKGPHVQVWITIYKKSCIHYLEMWIVKYERYLVIWSRFSYSLTSYYVTYISWSCAPCLHFVHGVYFCYFFIFWAFWIITIHIQIFSTGQFYTWSIDPSCFPAIPHTG